MGGEWIVPRHIVAIQGDPVETIESRVTAALVDVAGVVGVVLGGSRAGGYHTADSDYDLALYFAPRFGSGRSGTVLHRPG